MSIVLRQTRIPREDRSAACHQPGVAERLVHERGSKVGCDSSGSRHRQQREGSLVGDVHWHEIVSLTGFEEERGPGCWLGSVYVCLAVADL